MFHHVMPRFSLALTTPAAPRVNLPAAVSESTGTESGAQTVKVRPGLRKWEFRHQNKPRRVLPPAPL